MVVDSCLRRNDNWRRSQESQLAAVAGMTANKINVDGLIEPKGKPKHQRPVFGPLRKRADRIQFDLQIKGWPCRPFFISAV
jgi:hypothetical protein